MTKVADKDSRTVRQEEMHSIVPTIYYHPEGFDTSKRRLMGRHAAGEEFLKGMVRHSGANDFTCYAQSQEHFQHFVQNVRKLAPSAGCAWIQRRDMSALRGSLFMPGPVIGDLAWQRRCSNSRSFSLMGVTHTTATNRVMDAIGDLLVAPVQPWDALICTSNSVRAMVDQILEQHAEYLSFRFNTNKPIRPLIQLPVIPLGIDCAKFSPPEHARHSLRSQWRTKLGINEEDFVALYVGRLNFHAKAHPMPMYKALEEAARRTGKTTYLLMAGWFENDAIRNAFINGAKAFCPSVKTIFLDGRHPEVRNTIWFAADVFTSLVDNVQETFGLTPLEAMAAGLPVIVSDWDGYRETVRDGTDGMLVPTWASGPGSFQELTFENAAGAINYDRYIGYQSQYTNVDTAACASAFEALIREPQLRRRMGEAAQLRARSEFDWSRVIRSYQNLLCLLNEIRLDDRDHGHYASEQGCMPMRQDPSVLFSKYPTNLLQGTTIVSPNSSSTIAEFKQVLQHAMNTHSIHGIVTEEEISTLFKLLSSDGPKNVDRLCSLIPTHRPSAIKLTVLWLSKMGLVELYNDASVKLELRLFLGAEDTVR
jgi:alpha-maltose-1-phosphate synthase